MNPELEITRAGIAGLAATSTDRDAPTESGHCWCGLHVTCRYQCDRCMKRGAFAVTSTDRGGK